MKLIVGLGNYGDEYARTFHNMGFSAVSRLAEKLGVSVTKRNCDALIGEINLSGEKVILALPQTYMNLSGDAVVKLLAYYKLTARDMLVIYDDVDLPAATLRIRKNGSAGTHNGMRDIVAKIGTQDFPRVRIGIGKPPAYVPLADYVLSVVPQNMREAFDKAFDEASEAALKFVDGKLFT